MDQTKNTLQMVEELASALRDLKDLVRSGRGHGGENLRSTAARIYGELADDLVQLGIPRYFDQYGRTFPVFETALQEPSSLTERFVEDALGTAVRCLETAIGKLNRQLKQERNPAGRKAKRPSMATGKSKVFLVHGRDKVLRLSVEQVLTKLSIQAVVLADAPNLGQVLAEKFESNADVSFAVVLMTPDDVGGLNGDPPEKMQARARQNVILELGYFWGALGRENVCVLVSGHVEQPTDIQGIVYISADDEGWILKLGKELAHAGFAVDLNSLIA